jgi:hypothetical protein
MIRKDLLSLPGKLNLTRNSKRGKDSILGFPEWLIKAVTDDHGAII